MAQKINLYQAPYVLISKRLTVNIIIISFFCWIFVMIYLSTLLSSFVGQSARELEEYKKNEKVKTEQVGSGVVERWKEEEKNLQNQVVQIKKNIRVKSAVIEKIQELNLNENVKFSKILEDISGAWKSGLWMTKFKISMDKKLIYLKVNTYENKNIPLLMQKLSGLVFFKNIEFKSFYMGPSPLDNKASEFVLRTDDPSETKDEKGEKSGMQILGDIFQFYNSKKK
ncbi:MAG: hypothetical protein HQL93_03395 [Magnetococcales bacterium]|nr:hypothetical protein [Magnetococcales bacterium]